MKIVLNRCYGGFQLSKEACNYLGLEYDDYGYSYRDYELRSDTKLVECVETLGKRANGFFADLEVVEIPDGVEFEIENYDGIETAHEKHRIW